MKIKDMPEKNQDQKNQKADWLRRAGTVKLDNTATQDEVVKAEKEQ